MKLRAAILLFLFLKYTWLPAQPQVEMHSDFPEVIGNPNATQTIAQDEARPSLESRIAITKSKVIENEIATLNGDAWAGRYVQNTESTNVPNLLVSPSGFHLEELGCFHAHIQSFGDIEEDSGILSLSPTYEQPGARWKLDSELVPVQWANHKLLIPRNQFIRFSQDIPEIAGKDPMQRYTFPYYFNVLGTGELSGEPVFPGEYQKWLNKPAFQGEVTSFSPPTSREDYRCKVSIKFPRDPDFEVTPGAEIYVHIPIYNRVPATVTKIEDGYVHCYARILDVDLLVEALEAKKAEKVGANDYGTQCSTPTTSPPKSPSASSAALSAND